MVILKKSTRGYFASLLEKKTRRGYLEKKKNTRGYLALFLEKKNARGYFASLCFSTREKEW